MSRAWSIYFLRHGDTDCTVDGTFCGRHDPSLNANGRKLAEAFAEAYRRPPWRKIFASTSARAMQTAEPAAEAAGLPLSLDPALCELDFGAWETRHRSEIQHYDVWADKPADRAPLNGESGRQVLARARSAVERIATLALDSVLVVTHKAVIRLLICDFLGIDHNEYRRRIACPPGALTRFDFHGPIAQLVVMNDTSHAR
jgi:broad specificity phosphatase PhoE